MKAVLFATLAIGLLFVTVSPAFADSHLDGLQKATGRSHTTTNSDKVCGGELCSGKTGVNSSNEELAKVYTVTSKELSLKRALEGSRSLSILNDYYAYKGISFNEGIRGAFDGVRDVDAQQIIDDLPEEISVNVPVDNIPEIDPEDEINQFIEIGLYANPDFIEPPEIKTTLQKQDSDGPSKESEALRALESLPYHLRASYANPDHPQYIPPVVEIEVVEPEIVEIIEVDEPQMTEEYGICGEGTVFIDGVCSIPEMIPVDEVSMIEETIEAEPVPVNGTAVN